MLDAVQRGYIHFSFSIVFLDFTQVVLWRRKMKHFWCKCIYSSFWWIQSLNRQVDPSLVFLSAPLFQPPSLPHLPLHPAVLPLVSPLRPVAANRSVLSSPSITGTRPLLRDGDASSLPECSPSPVSPLSLHHSVYLWAQASGVLAW